ncbi:thioesterase II family protein [Nonomuraea sp. NPDC050153]|uniref:thioesterase II family protein n=1 Tax=Nonomuraea sp. NPDC050153 TaxID=3364359 RepID=UPI00379C65CB
MSRARVVCLPHAGGTAGFYLSWAANAPAGLEVLAVQYPGREDRITEPCTADLGELSDAIAAALAPLDDRPLVLFGHSLGAIVAYEVARTLEAAYGVRPAHLVVSGRRAPSDPPGGDVHRWPDAEMVDELVRLGGTDSTLLRQPEARSVYLPAIRADFRLAETYRRRPGPEPSCPLTAVIGTGDTEVNAEQARQWAAHTTAAFSLRLLPGGHFYLLKEEDAVLAILEGTAW